MKDLFEIGFDMLFSELHKIMVNKGTFVGFKGEISLIGPQDPALTGCTRWRPPFRNNRI